MNRCFVLWPACSIGYAAGMIKNKKIHHRFSQQGICFTSTCWVYYVWDSKGGVGLEMYLFQRQAAITSRIWKGAPRAAVSTIVLQMCRYIKQKRSLRLEHVPERRMHLWHNCATVVSLHWATIHQQHGVDAHRTSNLNACMYPAYKAYKRKYNMSSRSV